jgi:hypothetical protein
MKKFLLVTLMLSLPSAVFAFTKYEYNAAPKRNQAILTPGLAPAVIVVPLASMHLTPTQLKTMTDDVAQQKANGYVMQTLSYPAFLLRLGQLNAADINKSTDPSGSLIKSSLSKFKISPAYQALSAVAPSDVRGFSVGGVYLKNLGWSGMTEYFNAPGMGTCQYNIENLPVTKVTVYASAETVSYDIHGKVTDKYVQGSPKSGFLYSLSWFDRSYIQTLMCANKDYDASIMGKMISLANTIDGDID